MMMLIMTSFCLSISCVLRPLRKIGLRSQSAGNKVHNFRNTYTDLKVYVFSIEKVYLSPLDVFLYVVREV